ncbi:MAG TPA: DUF4410 domain-containing protein [Candidatus Nitrosotalea sp.]|nr:DUF4410 domain-containing protein [Candidatus Nitrosotalea sp.]
MNTQSSPSSLHLISTLTLCAILSAGCSSTGGESKSSSAASPAPTAGSAPASGPGFAVRYKADDGRTIEIGKATAADGGWRFKDPHMEKCWVAEDFRFTGIDTLYIAPTLVTAKYNKDEEKVLQLAKENIPVELERSLRSKNIFAHVVTREADIPTGVKMVKLENTIVEFSKGGGGARFFAGLYGAGQPVLRVQGKMTDGDKTVFTFEARRSGTSAGARMSGGYQKDEDIQIEDIRSMTLDLTDFMAALSGKYQAK